MARRQTYHHGDLRNALIETARAMLTEGDTGFTLRELARRAGVTPAAPYNHFRDKQALIAAVAAQGLARLRSRVERAMAASREQSAETQVAELVETYIRFAREFPAYFDLMFAPDVVANRTDELEAEAERTKEALRGFLRRLQAVNVIPDGDVDEQLRLVWSTAHGLTTLLKGPIGLDVKTRDDRRRLAQAAARMLVGGLNAVG
jgi:AcrR family transcriptional regulator